MNKDNSKSTSHNSISNVEEIQICITNKCQHGCLYCHLNKLEHNFINIKNIKIIIKKTKELKISAIRLTGGDIFEHPQLEEILKEIKANGLKTIVNVSNLSLNKINQIINLCDYALISFQDLNQISKLKKPLKELSKKTKLMGCIVFNESWETKQKIKELIEEIKEITFKDFFFLRNTEAKTRDYFLSMTKFVKNLNKINIVNKHQIFVANAFPLCYLSKEELKFTAGGKNDNGISKLYIDQNLNIKASAYSKNILGNIHNDWKEIYTKNIELLISTIKNQECVRCKYVNYCNGGISNKDFNENQDPLLKFTLMNKYRTEFQKEIVKKFNTKQTYYSTYHKLSGFYMNYPSPDYWDIIPKTKLNNLKFELLKNSTSNNFSIYIHYPFCIGKCKFCKIPVKIKKSDEEHINNILKEIKELGPIIKNKKIKTIYFGGGSPQLMGIDNAKIILEELFKYISEKPKEISFELFPKNYDDEFMRYIKNYVNRVSIGVQCFKDDIFEKMNRNTSKEEIIKFVKKIKEQGFETINFDIIYGLYDKEEEFAEDLKKILKLEPDQITFQPLHYANEIGFKDIENKQIHFNKLGRDILKQNDFRQITAEDFSKNKRFLYQDSLLSNKNIIGIGEETISLIDNYYIKDYKESYLKYKLTKKDLIYWDLFLKSRFLSTNINKFNNKHNIDMLTEFSKSINYLIKHKYISIFKDKEELNLKITEKGKYYVDLIANIMSLSNKDYLISIK